MADNARKLISLAVNSTSTLAAGEVVRLTGNKTVTRAQASSLAGLTGTLGAVVTGAPAGSTFDVATLGETPVLLESGIIPAPAAGQIIYVSAAVAGRATTTPPTTVALALGTIKDASQYAIDGTVVVVLEPISSALIPFVADWNDVRYFFLDNQNGDDDNVGFIDAPAGTVFTVGQAAAVARKTWSSGFLPIFPKFGNGRKFVCMIKARSDGATYKAADGVTEDPLQFTGVIDYGYGWVRGSTDLTNSADDKILQGARTVAVGPNGNGSWTVAGGATASVIPIAAGALAAEPTIEGFRVRFTGNTTTALANVTRMIQANAAGNLTTESDLDDVPVAGDTFFIEDPGVAFISGDIAVDQMMEMTAAGLTMPMCFSGLRFTSAVGRALRFNGGSPRTLLAFIRTTGGSGNDLVVGTCYQTFTISSFITDELLDSILLGVGACIDGAATFTDIQSLILRQTALKHATTNSQFSRVYALNMNVSGDFLYAGITLFNCVDAILGNGGAASIRPVRVFAGNGGGAGSLIFESCVQVQIRGLTAANLGFTPLIRIRGTQNGNNPSGNPSTLWVDDVTSTVGNAEVMLDLNIAVNCSVYQGRLAANTYASIIGSDIRYGLSAALGLLADTAVTTAMDNSRNVVYGPTSITAVTPQVGSSPLTNNSGGSLPVGTIVRTSGTTTMTSAKADTGADATGYFGILTHTGANGASALAQTAGVAAVRMDAAPTVGNICYLSEVNAGQGRDTPPAAAATNQKLRIGRIIGARVVAAVNYADVALQPDQFPAVSNGAAP